MLVFNLALNLIFLTWFFRIKNKRLLAAKDLIEILFHVYQVWVFTVNGRVVMNQRFQVRDDRRRGNDMVFKVGIRNDKPIGFQSFMTWSVNDFVNRGLIQSLQPVRNFIILIIKINIRQKHHLKI